MGRTVMEVGSDGVAVITLHNPPVNSLAVDGMYVHVCIALEVMF